MTETGATLPPREVEVLRLLAPVASKRAIATELVVTVPTVKTHVSRILGKLNFNRDHGLLPANCTLFRVFVIVSFKQACRGDFEILA